MLSKINGPKAIQNEPQNVQKNPIADKGTAGYSPMFASLNSEELKSAMGRPPKSDVKFAGIVLYGHSANYKDAMKCLDGFQALFRQVSNMPLGSVGQGTVDRMIEHLKDARSAAGHYHNENKMNPKREREVEAMLNLYNKLNSAIETLGQVYDKAATMPKSMTLGGAIAIERANLTRFDLISDPHKGQQPLDKPVVLGSGAVNTVYLAKWQKSDNSIETRVIKPLPIPSDGHTVPDLGQSLGLKDDNQMVAERNIATAKVASHLGLNQMAPMSEITVFDGKVCLEMPVAPGRSPSVWKMIPVPENHPSMRDYINYTKEPDGEKFLAQMNVFQTGVDKKGTPTFAKKTETFTNLPFTSDVSNDKTARLQEGLLNLQLIDALTGQADRNPGNIFISITPNDVTVTGIDHDLSFGERDGKEFTDLSPRTGWKIGQFVGLPPLMTRETFGKLMDINANDYKMDLVSSGLNDKQVELSMVRFSKVRDHALQLEKDGLVVLDLKQNVIDPKTNTSVSVSEFLMARKDQSYVQVLQNLQNGVLNDGVDLEQH